MTTNILSLKKFHFDQLLSAILISLTLISCVTINIYFPAAAAEKIAEQIVDDVLHSQEPAVIEEKKTENDQGNFKQKLHFTEKSLLAVINFVIPVAEAGQADISIDSPKIRSIRKRMEKRQAKLSKYYKSGAVGFTNDGLIASVSNKGLSVKQKSSVNKLIKAENNDRKALYSEIANANGHPEWQADIQKTFSKTWINKISSGWMYQKRNGKWTRK
ncbi:MAG: YdbL family protein [gamma proteobacterium symbiont of Bathyaustriella thionipta]|nr:YdbL family protein [gamma proteobacterium symbiont of Bathyaustriella thionipta]MCU7950581.1 YdbL family protein [gamma proteobacterium symbiont of Bathyaustriella thionipta]MCU7952497.1 YdbL family protein [gamma proteobacterium symbiont of Bathyaustriella thionipta]MCU7957089.1 YdbL family protein [gamma proteobacterium symbiont of Bathyaustriella thionipta]MCU7967040.1 YdbL family protein [gamma proteobacterium symbiont of Bathyaustriella thionipta]